MDKIDIKTLAKELKDGHGVPGPKASAEKKMEVKRHDEKGHSVKSSTAISEFEDLLSRINSRADFNSDGCVYIDSELHEILRHIKLRNKLKVGYLVSHLIEQFIVEHQQEIAGLLRPVKNRFMEK